MLLTLFMEENTFDTVYSEFHLLPESEKKLMDFFWKLENFLSSQGISYKMRKKPHLTVMYQQALTTTQLFDILVDIAAKKKELSDVTLYDPEAPYDQTLHLLQIWESNVNGQIYLVLTPHNPDSLYKQFIHSDHISPHISLAKLYCSLEKAQEMLPDIKKILKPYLVGGILLNVQETITHIK